MTEAKSWPGRSPLVWPAPTSGIATRTRSRGEPESGSDRLSRSPDSAEHDETAPRRPPSPVRALDRRAHLPRPCRGLASSAESRAIGSAFQPTIPLGRPLEQEATGTIGIVGRASCRSARVSILAGVSHTAVGLLLVVATTGLVFGLG
jgi:hypothetical protein